MAGLPQEFVRPGTDYLIRVLRQEPVITYARFYDGGDECRQRLCDGLEITLEQADWYSAEGMMDEAIFALERAGIVKTTVLSEKLADDEQNYEISLTEKGQEIIST